MGTVSLECWVGVVEEFDFYCSGTWNIGAGDWFNDMMIY